MKTNCGVRFKKSLITEEKAFYRTLKLKSSSVEIRAFFFYSLNSIRIWLISEKLLARLNLFEVISKSYLITFEGLFRSALKK